MIISRSIDDLTPETRIKVDAFLRACEAEGITLLVTCTYRDSDAQAYLYASGRTRPGPILTNARPGESKHNSRQAIDCVPLIAGKPVWNELGKTARQMWQRVGALGEQSGLEWAARWSGRFTELGHFQNKG